MKALSMNGQKKIIKGRTENAAALMAKCTLSSH